MGYNWAYSVNMRENVQENVWMGASTLRPIVLPYSVQVDLWDDNHDHARRADLRHVSCENRVVKQCSLTRIERRMQGDDERECGRHTSWKRRRRAQYHGSARV